MPRTPFTTNVDFSFASLVADMDLKHHVFSLNLVLKGQEERGQKYFRGSSKVGRLNRSSNGQLNLLLSQKFGPTSYSLPKGAVNAEEKAMNLFS